MCVNRRNTRDSVEARARILEALRAGHWRVVAASAGGITTETLRTWIAKDPEFAAEVQAAEREAEKLQYESVLAKAKKNGTLGIEVLARRWPKRYGRKDRIEGKVNVQLEVDALSKMTPEQRIARLEKALAYERAQLRKANASEEEEGE